MTGLLTPEERRTLAVVLALVAAGYAALGWRAWREPEPPMTLNAMDSLFAVHGARMAHDTLKAEAAVSGKAPRRKAKAPALVVRWPLDVNRADSLHLLELPGIGPGKVAAILAYRRRQGSFQRVEDLLKVGGIGQATLEKMRDKVVVKVAASTAEAARPGGEDATGPHGGQARP